jgi:hypothetical protein
MVKIHGESADRTQEPSEEKLSVVKAGTIEQKINISQKLK